MAGIAVYSAGKKEKYLHDIAEGITAAIAYKLDPYGTLQEVANFIDILQQGEERYKEIKINDDGFSGFPHYATFSDVTSDREAADLFIEKLPTVEQCVEQCLKQLHSGNSDFSFLQKKARKVRFFHDLQKLPLPTLGTVSIVGQEKIDEFNGFTVLYKGYNLAKMKFLEYVITIYQSGSSTLIQAEEATDKLCTLIKSNEGLSSAEMFTALNGEKKSAVVSVERRVLGPFHALYTTPGEPQIRQALEEAAEEDYAAYVLEIETQTSEDAYAIFTGDVNEALKKYHKQGLEQEMGSAKDGTSKAILYRRNFICSSPAVYAAIDKRFISMNYITHKYVIPTTLETESEKGGSNDS